MVNYKTRIFFEPDTNSLGADVIIYSDEGDVIDTILITSESKYNELAEQIQNIDSIYINLEELTNILANVQNDLVINATKLAGFDVDYFSPVGHTHNELTPKNHASTSNNYGVASNSNYGHTKLRNNLTTSQYVEGEALSAYQGKVLKGLVDNVSAAIIGENVPTFNNPTSNATNCRFSLKKVGNIVFCLYLVTMKSVSQSNLNKDLLISNTIIPEGFRPGEKQYFSISEYSSMQNMLLRIDSDGKIYGRSYKQEIINCYGSCFWFIDSANGGD